MLKFLRDNKKFSTIALIMLIASFALGIIVPVIIWMLPDDESESTSLETYIQAEILAMEEELALYQEAVVENPEDGDAWVNKANLEYDLGSLFYETQRPEEGAGYFKDALGSYQEALKYNPGDVQLLTDLATAGLYAGDNELAEKKFKEVIEIEPDYIHARVNYGIFLYNIKDDKEGAVEQWEAALDTNPENEEVIASIESLIALAKE